MKLRGKFITIVTLPVTLLCIITSILCINNISSSLKGNIQNDLYAMSLIVRDNISLGTGNSDVYHVNEKGELWNGEHLNITDQFSLYDGLQKNNNIDVTIFLGNTRVATTIRKSNGQRDINSTVSKTVEDEVLKKGKEYFAESVDVQGVEYFCQYIPLYDSTSTNPVGIVFVGRERETIRSEVQTVLSKIIGTGLVVLTVCLIAAVLIVSLMVKRIKKSVQAVNELSNGNMKISISESDMKSRDEVGDILRAVDKLKVKLENVVKDINDECANVLTAANELSQQTSICTNHIEQIDIAVSEVANGATNQAQETQDASNNIVRMGDMLDSTGKETDNLMNKSNNMDKVNKDAIAILDELKTTNDDTKEAISRAQEQTEANNKSVQKIKDAIQLVHAIADQTSLLALNAQIEAARAGESGRGFTVVADNIQKLAAQSNASAKDIENIAETLIEDSNKVYAAMNKVDKTVNIQTEKVEGIQNIFNELSNEIESCTQSINSIVGSMNNVDELRIKVVESAQNLSAIAEENAASTEETSATVNEMTDNIKNIADNSVSLETIANELRNKISFFKV